jgi:hypothetical protein
LNDRLDVTVEAVDRGAQPARRRQEVRRGDEPTRGARVRSRASIRARWNPPHAQAAAAAWRPHLNVHTDLSFVT